MVPTTIIDGLLYKYIYINMNMNYVCIKSYINKRIENRNRDRDRLFK